MILKQNLRVFSFTFCGIERYVLIYETLVKADGGRHFVCMSVNVLMWQNKS